MCYIITRTQRKGFWDVQFYKRDERNVHARLTMSPSQTILKKFFGFDSFRKGQEETIQHILSGRDVLCVMPTGSGKSLCYQIPAMLMEGVTIVLSPLISLMKDQVDALRQNGVRAAAINSAMEWDDVKPVFRQIRAGETKLLYIAPERLEGVGFREFLAEIDVSMVVVDEAHCVSHWGHDFRPSYLNISPTVASLPNRPVVAAFTATATHEVRADIVAQLDLADPHTLITGFDRENLFFQVEHPLDKTGFLLDYLKKFPNMPGIVYCSTRKAVEEVCSDLRAFGVQAVRYHAGLDDEERRTNQESFLYDRATVMVATNAFGMGIDKSNVRFVIHYNMPSSIDSYYQEAGRAGRDSAPADCILMFGRKDVVTARYLISQSDDSSAREASFKKLRAMIDYVNTSGCLRYFILRYFGEEGLDDACEDCGNCSSVIERTDVTVEAQKILSCVYRMAEKTGGRTFGQTVLTDVLRGSGRSAVKSLGFDRISTWGLMKSYSAEAVRRITDFLMAEGFLDVDDGEFPTLRLTGKARAFFKSGTRLLMRKYEEKPDRKPKKGVTSIARKEVVNEDLFEILRELRRKLAAGEGVPPYVVFSDKTLFAICEALPENDRALLDINGVGQVKLEKYGDAFLEAVRNWRSS
ncbi:DNA helicase RecQ [Synergistaceae bacterium OttesenSCG-928-I11]|nr:DNA helicase RecQ [Synergistaceae bacterium OttesenSCG-928-I11]